MFGAIVGDIVGSIYEFNNCKSKEFPLFTDQSFFTDDTVCTIAIADALINDKDPTYCLLDWCKSFPDRGYGGMFRQWIESSNPKPYNSFGNGSAMRISSIVRAATNEAHLFELSDRFTEITHNHEEGLKGARATALAIYLARNGERHLEIKRKIENEFLYDLSQSVDEIRYHYSFDETCQGSVPQAIRCYLEASSFEDAIRNAISIGGDSDTIAAITGSIAEARWQIPDQIAVEAWRRLPVEMQNVVSNYYIKYP